MDQERNIYELASAENEESCSKLLLLMVGILGEEQWSNMEHNMWSIVDVLFHEHLSIEDCLDLSCMVVN